MNSLCKICVLYYHYSHSQMIENKIEILTWTCNIIVKWTILESFDIIMEIKKRQKEQKVVN